MMEIQPAEDMTDGMLLDAIGSHDHQMRHHAERLSVLSREWTRRHATERCAVGCREPRAPLAKVAE